ncbi:MAG: regulatory iron-sulfur-containing complex subunit RicT [Rikenellaceae bacterium]
MSDIKLEIPRGCCFVNSSDEDNIKAIPCKGCNKLNSSDWLEDIDTLNKSDIFEIRFKNTRKGYYQNVNQLALKVGDIVAVEATPGHDIGIISASGEMVGKQMRKTGFRPNGFEFKKIYRKAKPSDIAKWQKAIHLEHKTMISSRQIAASLELNMKIGDVEYQGDGAKAIFYYIADERVDFRELIKIFAEQFKIRIEMKQIGARQEAGRIGGIGSCGRELCCSRWVSNFVSVTTSSARFQEISLNPQKLAGQCSKLKCCLNYEVDSYIDYKKKLPRVYQPLETMDAQYHLVKTDVLRGLMTFSSDPNSMINVITLDSDRVREITRLNKRGIKPERLQSDEELANEIPEPKFKNVVGEESITRFDSTKSRGNKNNKGNFNKNRRGGGSNKPNDTENTQGKRQNTRSQSSSQPQNSGQGKAKQQNVGQQAPEKQNTKTQNANQQTSEQQGTEQAPRPQRRPRPRRNENNNGDVKPKGEAVNTATNNDANNSNNPKGGETPNGAPRKRYYNNRRRQNNNNSGNKS